MLAFIDAPIIIGIFVVMAIAVAIPIGLIVYFVRASRRREGSR